MKKTRLILKTSRFCLALALFMLTAVFSAKAQTQDDVVGVKKATIIGRQASPSITTVAVSKVKAKEADGKTLAVKPVTGKKEGLNKGVSASSRNISRRLPKNYDDSKTNRVSKN